MKFILKFMIVLMLFVLAIPSFSQDNDSTGVIFIYTNPTEMKVKIKGDEYKCSQEKKENELVFKNVPAGKYTCRFTNSQKNLKTSFMVLPNDTLVIMANIYFSSQDPVTFATIDELREVRIELKKNKEVRDSILTASKKKYLENVINSAGEKDQKVYEPTDEEILIKTENQDITQSTDGDTTYYFVEEMPEFNGEDPAIEFRKYILENMTLGEDSCGYQVEKKLTVVSQFIVGSDGNIRDVEIISQNAPECIEELVVDFIESSPRWMPGFQGGKPVNVIVTFPITFIPPKQE